MKTSAENKPSKYLVEIDLEEPKPSLLTRLKNFVCCKSADKETEAKYLDHGDENENVETRDSCSFSCLANKDDDDLMPRPRQVKASL